MSLPLCQKLPRVTPKKHLQRVLKGKSACPVLPVQKAEEFCEQSGQHSEGAQVVTNLIGRLMWENTKQSSKLQRNLAPVFENGPANVEVLKDGIKRRYTPDGFGIVYESLMDESVSMGSSGQNGPRVLKQKERVLLTANQKVLGSFLKL